MSKPIPERRLAELFGFTPTEDFRLFWEFACESARECEPQAAFSDSTMIVLTGPFDVLAGRFDRETPRYSPRLHWRYFGDTPEFVTLMTGGSDGLHWGYVIERPGDLPCGMAGYYAHDDVSMFEVASSPFDLLESELTQTIEQLREDAEMFPDEQFDADDPGGQLALCESQLAALSAFRSRHQVAKPDTSEASSALVAYLDDCNTPPEFSFFDLERAAQLAEDSESEVRRLVKSGLSEPQAQLRLGRLMWHWHHDGNPDIDKVAGSLLRAAYAELGYNFFQETLREHREHRRRPNLDVFAG